MKLLTWMHQKIRQNNNEMFKEFPHGQTIVNNHNPYPKQNHGGVNFLQPPRDSYGRRSFASLESTGLDDPERDSSVEFTESFHGFLAIGTLGAETYISEPQTPTLVISVDNIAERETEVTQSELNLINEELEKVLAVEEKDDSWTDSSSRNSHVSNGRSSNTSTFSLNRKSVEVMEGNENGRIAICPLQEYLLGSAVELPERRSTAKKNRASLGELFQRHKQEENYGVRSERSEKQVHKEGDKSSTNLVRKILRKKIGNLSAAHGEATEYASDTKFHKMLHLFHKKVHPETSTDIEKSGNQNRNSIKACDSRIAYADQSFGGELLLDDGFANVYDETHEKRNMFHYYKNQSGPTKITSAGCDLNVNKELWIKTDADYLVLEL